MGEWCIPRIKVKIGELWGRAVHRDLTEVDLVRRVTGEDVVIFVDANGAYGGKQAIRVGRALSEREATWLEEPVSSNDLLTGRPADRIS